MTSHRAIALAAGVLALPFLGACSQPRYVVLSQGTTPPIRTTQHVVAGQPIYCVTAPTGYVVSQDKWDPHLIPCPTRVAILTTPSAGAKATPDRPGPTQPTNPTRSLPSQEDSTTSSGTSASVTRNPDGSEVHTVSVRGRFGDVGAREVVPAP